MSKTYNQKINTSGFTLIETFVAITILLVAVLGPLGLFSKALVDTIFAQNQVTSLYLAQEGIELAMNYKINYSVSSCPEDDLFCNSEGQWLGDLSLCVNQSCSIEFNSSSININSLSSAPDAAGLYYKDGIFTHDNSGASPTIFSRKIDIRPIFDINGQPYGAEVSSEAWWKDGRTSLERKTKLQTFIYR